MGRRGAVLVLMPANPVTVAPAPAQLVGEPVGENDPLPKPKWIRWRTYARKAVELGAPYECYDDALIAQRQRSSGICDNGKTSGHDVGDKNDLRLIDCRRPDGQDGADRIRLPLP